MPNNKKYNNAFENGIFATGFQVKDQFPLALISVLSLTVIWLD